jgi:hypothetical protein
MIEGNNSKILTDKNSKALAQLKKKDEALSKRITNVKDGSAKSSAKNFLASP